MKRKYLLSGVTILISVIIIITAGIIFDIIGWYGTSESVTISISENDNLTVICSKLEENGVILNRHVLKLYCRMTKSDAIIYPGEITVYKNSSYQQILDAITHPHTNTIRITIPEGFELREIAKRLLDNQLISDEETFYQALDEYTLETKQGVSISGKEMLTGFLFPDTYEISKNVSEREIIQMLTSNFNSKWTDDHESIANAKNMDTKDVIILASIVEREANKEEDFPLVASVFLNRLKYNRPLESCATVQFILKERKPVLSVEDTKIDSPYNTYQNIGLPPAPISAPGMRAIEAVLNAPQTDYLYFFTDLNGINHYSKSFEEHNAQIAEFGL